MLLLNTCACLYPLTGMYCLNTSYVTVKQNKYKNYYFQMSSLNTSYVTVKQYV